MTALSASLLGGFNLSIDGCAIEPAEFERPSGLRLLKLLLATTGHALRREEAAELLWPELDPQRSQAALRKALHFARKSIGRVTSDPVIQVDAGRIRFANGVAVDLDVDRLRALVASLRADVLRGVVDQLAMQAVLHLRSFELLPDDGPEEWLVGPRERLRADALDALLGGAELAAAVREDDLALRLVDRALDLEPAEESAHRVAIELHLAAGRIAAAQRQLLACARALAEVYDVAPTPALERLIDDAARREAGRNPIGESALQASAVPAAGASLLATLVDAIAALADGRHLVLAYENVRLERPGARLVGAYRR